MAALGAGEVVSDAADAVAVGHAISQVLTDGSYRLAAARMADEIRALPAADASVEMLERIATP